MQQLPFEIKSFNPTKVDSGKVEWTSPSNIAIVKYWGKFGRQLPKNTSLSLTLQNARSQTAVAYETIKSIDKNGIKIEFEFEGEKNVPFAEKIEHFLTSMEEFMPFIRHCNFKISSSNSFPHSSGIASSASAMSALVMCLCDIECKLGLRSEIDFKMASYLSRLGSGSASRSVIAEVGAWGDHPSIINSSNDFAVDVSEIHPVFNTFHDDILIVSAAEKSVSSTAGHALMNGNVYADARYKQANDRIDLLLEAMRSGDLAAFGKIAEDEAMTLHALMMCSDPSYVLMEPGTLDMIREIRAFRESTDIPVYFTLDAGPNIHLLYPDSVKEEVNDFINKKLLNYTANGTVIKDNVGNGPKKIY